MKKKILITGGAGFIGSNLGRYLSKLHDVSIIDDLSTGFESNIDFDCKKYIYTINNDTSWFTKERIEETDIVIHLAATVGVKNVMKDSYKTIKNNIEATDVVLDYCSKYNKRCIIASTSEVYGKNTNVLKETDDIILGPSCKSRWSYAASKLIDEFMALSMYENYALPVTIVRFFNVSGPGQVSQYGMVIPKFIDQALNNEDITIFGDGSQTRCFTHINDVVYLLHLIMDSEKSYGKVINIGNPEEITINDLADYIIIRTFTKSQITFNNEKIYGSGFEDMKRRVPDVSILNSIIGFESKWLSYIDIVEDILKGKSK